MSLLTVNSSNFKTTAESAPVKENAGPNQNNNHGLNLSLTREDLIGNYQTNLKKIMSSSTAVNSSAKCKSSHSIDAILGLRAVAAAAAHQAAQNQAAAAAASMMASACYANEGKNQLCN